MSICTHDDLAGIKHGTLFVCFVLVLGLGCGSEQAGGVEGPAETRIKSLTMLYVGYMNTHGRRPPGSGDEFKRYIADAGASELQAAGVTRVDELFVSPRDNEPYVVLYGDEAVRLISRGIVAYERTGKNGRRFVGYRLGFVNEVDDIEFRNVVPAL